MVAVPRRGSGRGRQTRPALGEDLGPSSEGSRHRLPRQGKSSCVLCSFSFLSRPGNARRAECTVAHEGFISSLIPSSSLIVGPCTSVDGSSNSIGLVRCIIANQQTDFFPVRSHIEISCISQPIKLHDWRPRIVKPA